MTLLERIYDDNEIEKKMKKIFVMCRDEMRDCIFEELDDCGLDLESEKDLELVEMTIRQYIRENQ